MGGAVPRGGHTRRLGQRAATSMTKKVRPSLADYVGIVIGPLLIMALVGSLVFFLLLILYEGFYETRLQVILFSFVFAIVLIARLSMRSDLAPRAGLYGAVLGVLVWLGLQRFVMYPPEAPLGEWRWLVHLGLMALIWWAAHRLTWDCTHIDESVEASGKGVLESAGLDPEGEPAEEPVERGPPEQGRADPTPGIFAWWDRYKKYREERQRRRHNPGVWVVYFSLAALPIFGLGQSLIPLEHEGQRRYAFWLMVIYVASGLGLLLTTSFLGLRRYLRQRKLRMPAAMTGVWLASGAVLALAFLIIAAVLPRPSAEYPVLDLGQLARSEQRDASRWGTDVGGQSKGEGRPASDQPDGDRDGSAGSGGQRERGGGGSAQGEQGQGSSGGQQGGGQTQSGQSGSQSSQGQGASSGSSQQDGEPRQRGAGQQDQGGQQSQPGRRGQTGNPGPGGKQKAAGEAGGKAGSQGQKGRKGTAGGRMRGRTTSLPRMLMPRLHPAIKTIVLVLGALVAGFFVLRALLRFLAHFTFWARDLLAALQSWWQGLTAWWQPRQATEEETGPAYVPVRRTLSDYPNPFLTGWADGRPVEELVRYSFEALEAYADDQGAGRREGETPLEFAARVGEESPGLEKEAHRLAGLYSRVAYSRSRLAPSNVEGLRSFWERLEANVEAPLPA